MKFGRGKNSGGGSKCAAIGGSGAWGCRNTTSFCSFFEGGASKMSYVSCSNGKPTRGGKNMRWDLGDGIALHWSVGSREGERAMRHCLASSVLKTRHCSLICRLPYLFFQHQGVDMILKMQCTAVLISVHRGNEPQCRNGEGDDARHPGWRQDAGMRWLSICRSGVV